MKQILAFLLLSSNLIFTSCYAQNLSKSIENSLAEKTYQKFRGHLYIKETTDKTILILCQTEGSKAEYFDRAFTIFSENSVSKFALDANDIYEIQIPESRKYAVIYNQNKNKIHFIGTSDKEDFINSIKQNSSLSKAVTNEDFLGYGFSYMNSEWLASDIKSSKYHQPFNTLDFANTANPQLKYALPPDDDGGPVSCTTGTCTSGGAGSSSCSITQSLPDQSCTVTCNSGYYACCVSSSVRCYCCKQ